PAAPQLQDRIAHLQDAAVPGEAALDAAGALQAGVAESRFAEPLDPRPRDLHRPRPPLLRRCRRRSLPGLHPDGDSFGLEILEDDPPGEERREIDPPAPAVRG